MSQHRPKPLERYSRDTQAEHRHIAFQIGADEVLPQGKTIPIALRQVTVRETAPQPQAFTSGTIVFNLQNEH